MCARCLLITWVWVAVAVPTLAATGPRERDVWYVLVADGQRYGHQHVVVERQADGSYRYQVRTRVLIDLFGVQKQEITGRVVWVVDSKYAPISMHARTEMATGTRSFNGRVEAGRFVIREEGSDSAQSHVLAADLIPDVCLDDWLIDRAASEAVRVRVIGSEDGTLDTVAARPGKTDDGKRVWHLEMEQTQASGNLLLGDDGFVQETRLDRPALRIIRSTKDEADKIEYRVMVGDEVLMFPIDRELGNVARLTELTVRLRWKDISFDRFKLQDRRQRVVKKSEADGRFEVTLKVVAPELPERGIAFPIGAEEFAPYLASTRYIEPKHPKIVERAKEIVAGKKTALEAVRALSQWVAAYVEGSMPVETLTGSQVLERKTGKCTEYTTLFASLARAVGIPTRVALGVRMMGGHWGGHMWNEAYVGEWVPVDASANEVGGSFALLKFIHSDTVAGTQELRWALTESLAINIVDSKSRPSRLAETHTTGIVGRTYTNTDYSCRISAPEAGWSLEESRQGGAVLVRFRVSDRDDILVHFVCFGAPAGVSGKVLLDSRLGLFRQQYEEFELGVSEARSVAECSGHTIQFARAPMGDESGRMKTTEVAWVCGTSAYLLNIIAPADGHEATLDEFEAILASFKFLGEE